jgi:hypothetical protein
MSVMDAGVMDAGVMDADVIDAGVMAAGGSGRPGPRPDRPAGRGSGVPARGWQPLAGDALLDRLRHTGRPRPAVDPALALSLRRYLEIELSGPDAGPQAAWEEPLVATKGRLTRALACADHARPVGDGRRRPTLALACGALVDGLFRQLVTVGSFGDPLDDGLAGLAVDGAHAELVSWIRQLPVSQRDLLRAEVTRQADALRRRWPALDPAWLPRTQVVLRSRVGPGVELSGRVDLAIGRPHAQQASVAFVEVTSGRRRAEHRADRHFYALIEALRSPVPPFAVATYYTRTGEVDVDAVGPDLLFEAARRTVAGVRLLRRRGEDVGPSPAPAPRCDGCAVVPHDQPCSEVGGGLTQSVAA